MFRWALRCVPALIPEQWRDNKMTETIPVYAISVEPAVREEAVQVLFRTVRDLPQSRFAVMRGMANFILRVSDEYPALINTSLALLVRVSAPPSTHLTSPFACFHSCLCGDSSPSTESPLNLVREFESTRVD